MFEITYFFKGALKEQSFQGHTKREALARFILAYQALINQGLLRPIKVEKRS